MRNLFFLLVLFSFSCIAQEGINYQGVATNTSGAELINQNISIQTSIISDSANGAIQWQETHNTTTDQFGLFNLVIGQGASTGSGQSSSFDNIQWGSGNHYLKVEMDATGGSNFSLISTSQMMSVPYALYAENANINYDSISYYFSRDSVLISQTDGNDFLNNIANSDFGLNDIDQIPQSLDGKKIILFSTEKTIYLTDSVGSFLSSIYSVENDHIGCLTSNANKDTLYFLQVSSTGSNPVIMMMTINNLNSIAVGSVPKAFSDIRQFKYFNGDFYYLTSGGSFHKISNGNVSMLDNSSNISFTVSNGGTLYRVYSSGGNYFLTPSSFGPHQSTIYDIDYSDLENRMYMYDYNGPKISYWDFNNNTQTILFDANNSYQQTSGGKEQVVHYDNNHVYFNLAMSLFSIDNNGSSSRIITSSTDNKNINGIVIVD